MPAKEMILSIIYEEAQKEKGLHRRYKQLDSKTILSLLLAFVGLCLLIIGEWVSMSDGVFLFLWIDFKVTDQLIGLAYVGVTTHIT